VAGGGDRDAAEGASRAAAGGELEIGSGGLNEIAGVETLQADVEFVCSRSRALEDQIF
jgi:hypothetical protein